MHSILKLNKTIISDYVGDWVHGETWKVLGTFRRLGFFSVETILQKIGLQGQGRRTWWGQLKYSRLSGLGSNIIMITCSCTKGKHSNLSNSKKSSKTKDKDNTSSQEQLLELVSSLNSIEKIPAPNAPALKPKEALSKATKSLLKVVADLTTKVSVAQVKVDPLPTPPLAPTVIILQSDSALVEEMRHQTTELHENSNTSALLSNKQN
ncbi:hypothetical protein DL93DRAFT_2203564 [Clavulina sp. PMI_390]|nr:hypothetical protein DL93DRAFT_2203564 [Clavulina sp. PMI_390]